MRFHLLLETDDGEVIYKDTQRVVPGFDLEVHLSTPILRYSISGYHHIEGFRLSFIEQVEKKPQLA